MAVRLRQLLVTNSDAQDYFYAVAMGEIRATGDEVHAVLKEAHSIENTPKYVGKLLCRIRAILSGKPLAPSYAKDRRETDLTAFMQRVVKDVRLRRENLVARTEVVAQTVLPPPPISCPASSPVGIDIGVELTPLIAMLPPGSLAHL